MNALFDTLFAQYEHYPPLEIALEIIAVLFGIASVYYSRANNILVFPTGIVSTGIFVYLLAKWSLLGDLLVNLYYLLMSIYGWVIWSRTDEDQQVTPISFLSRKEQSQVSWLFLVSMLAVWLLYYLFDKLHPLVHAWIPYVDIFTTAVFFSGMWLMAKRKLPHWYFWIVGNMISIPLYFIKGYTFTSIQYVVFLVLAIWGLAEWKLQYNLQMENQRL